MARLIDKQPFNLVKKPRKKIKKLFNKVIERKVVNKKPLYLIKTLARKTNALCVRLQLRKINLKVQS